MKKTRSIFLLWLLAITLSMTAQGGDKGAHTLELTVVDKDTKEPIIMATVQLQPTGILAVTDADGHATIKNVEAGTYTVNISYVGYQPVSTAVKISKHTNLSFKMDLPHWRCKKSTW